VTTRYGGVTVGAGKKQEKKISSRRDCRHHHGPPRFGTDEELDNLEALYTESTDRRGVSIGCTTDTSAEELGQRRVTPRHWKGNPKPDDCPGWCPRLVSRGHPPVITPPSTAFYTSLHRPNNVMKWREFLHIPKRHRRARSKARSEIGSVEGQSGADLAVPRPTESTPDLGIGTSTLSTSSPSVPRDQEPNGRQTTLSWVILLTSLAVQHRPSH